MFFRELEIPLIDIKKIMDTPNYDKEQILITQKALLEQKRNRLNGIIELITDVMKGVNTMSFEAFSNDEVQKIVNHTLECMSKENIDEQVQKYGSLENYKEYLSSGFTNEQAMYVDGQLIYIPRKNENLLSWGKRMEHQCPKEKNIYYTREKLS